MLQGRRYASVTVPLRRGKVGGHAESAGWRQDGGDAFKPRKVRDTANTEARPEHPAHTSALDFWPPELGERQFLSAMLWGWGEAGPPRRAQRRVAVKRGVCTRPRGKPEKGGRLEAAAFEFSKRNLVPASNPFNSFERDHAVHNYRSNCSRIEVEQSRKDLCAWLL